MPEIFSGIFPKKQMIFPEKEKIICFFLFLWNGTQPFLLFFYRITCISPEKGVDYKKIFNDPLSGGNFLSM